MAGPRAEQEDRRLDFLREMLDENISIAGDVARIGASTWAIHGVIPVDGDAIIAEFDTYAEARATLERLSTERLVTQRPLAARRQESSVTSDIDEPVGFESHIRPMFRERDRQAMQSRFDLWSSDDVSQHADAILTCLRDGTMPCDSSWPPAQVDLFQRWVETGMPQ